MSKGSGKTSAAGNAEKGSLSASDWVEAAIEVLVASGVADLKIERLAAALGVSKGSFYWHFSNREDLLKRVLDEWSRVATFDVDERLHSGEPDPARRLLRFMQLPLSSERATRMADLELAIMGWARRDRNAQAALEAVDRRRTANAHALLREIGVPEAKACERSHEAYALIRYVALRRDLSLEERRDLTEQVHRRLIRTD
jgi:AcrR family transcriptional regulator